MCTLDDAKHGEGIQKSRKRGWPAKTLQSIGGKLRENAASIDVPVMPDARLVICPAMLPHLTQAGVLSWSVLPCLQYLTVVWCEHWAGILQPARLGFFFSVCRSGSVFTDNGAYVRRWVR